MNEETGIPYYVGLTTRAGAGDYVCLLSACREFTRRTGNPVYTDTLPDVIASYLDPNLRFGKTGVRFMVSPKETHRIKEPGDYVNYYGTYLAAMGLLKKGDDPKLELPKFEPMESYAIIQPFSVYAQNPSTEYLQAVVDGFQALTGVTVYVVGKMDTPRVLKNVNYDLLADGITNLMKIVQSASFVMSPRSLVAHLAAGYSRPSFVWVPEDGENWHLNYSDWKRVLHSHGEGPIVAGEVLKFFLKAQGLL